jgi:hypothetical protein
MASVCLAGYILYVKQFDRQLIESTPEELEFELSPKYWPALKFGITLQIILGVFAALMLDMGESASFFGVAAIGYWLAVLMIIARRPINPTAADIIFIRWGTLILLTIEIIIAPYVWDAIGRSELTGWERLWRHWAHH